MAVTNITMYMPRTFIYHHIHGMYVPHINPLRGVWHVLELASPCEPIPGISSIFYIQQCQVDSLKSTALEILMPCKLTKYYKSGLFSFLESSLLNMYLHANGSALPGFWFFSLEPPASVFFMNSPSGSNRQPGMKILSKHTWEEVWNTEYQPLGDV